MCISTQRAEEAGNTKRRYKEHQIGKKEKRTDMRHVVEQKRIDFLGPNLHRDSNTDVSFPPGAFTSPPLLPSLLATITRLLQSSATPSSLPFSYTSVCFLPLFPSLPPILPFLPPFVAHSLTHSCLNFSTSFNRFLPLFLPLLIVIFLSFCAVHPASLLTILKRIPSSVLPPGRYSSFSPTFVASS